ncbi:protein O-GlcNAcase-like isoform X3 [Artemia franciscana]|uniref:protein O-GlcNAcase n=1 Tax=Artemia franciscana TaxID=6661 RepID=A0AA88HLN6_ARTSF|nr:hypothetical protein QYM36_013564 [Artemia franciscana]KAK2709926.1 hypothetical protein QYM36_013564 [Artemia franciscana]
MTERRSGNRGNTNQRFICGVIEGFYGRPWTLDQRKDLYTKLARFGMDTYVYAPKDDYKHRAYWREMYTVEEGDHLTALITAAKSEGIKFVYALSPGLDMCYSSAKEVNLLKKKLDQIVQFGCEAFALLFDDIESEMNEQDKEMFKSFAFAQVSVSNQIYEHLSQPECFLFCPTQYCASRAIPDVRNSEYLNTIGEKLAPGIDIFWTGPKVISRIISVESIEEISEVLHRPPVIWDNLHANDYDQKRLFLGPYSGRVPELIPKLRGVITNPNCEYGANFVAIHSLAQWSRCKIDGKKFLDAESESADIRLEKDVASSRATSTITLYGDEGADDRDEVYIPRRALKRSVIEWLSEFRRSKSMWGPITKPQPSGMSPISLSSFTPNQTKEGQNQDELSYKSPPAMELKPIDSSDTVEVHFRSPADSPHSAEELPSSKSSGILGPATPLSLVSQGSLEGMDVNSGPVSPAQKDEPMQEPDVVSFMAVEEETAKESRLKSIPEVDTGPVDSTRSIPSPPYISNQMITDLPPSNSEFEITVEDIFLLCDLFYLPFEHGTEGLKLLQEFSWLKQNSHLLNEGHKGKGASSPSREVREWHDRASRFDEMSRALNRLFTRLTYINNRELLYDLYPYVWDMRGVVSLLNAYVKWLGFNKSSNESFVTGEEEPWVFRGGLATDLQRLLPIESNSDLFLHKSPDVVTRQVYTIRPYLPSEEQAVYNLCNKMWKDSGNPDITEQYPELLGDKMIGPFVTLSPEFCFVVEDNSSIVGYAVAALDGANLWKKSMIAWAPEMQRKYNLPVSEVEHKTIIEDIIKEMHQPQQTSPVEMRGSFSSPIHVSLLNSVCDQSVPKRLVTCVIAALRGHGSSGCYVELKKSDLPAIEFYCRLGFNEISGLDTENTTYFGRHF